MVAVFVETERSSVVFYFIPRILFPRIVFGCTVDRAFVFHLCHTRSVCRIRRNARPPLRGKSSPRGPMSRPAPLAPVPPRKLVEALLSAPCLPPARPAKMTRRRVRPVWWWARPLTALGARGPRCDPPCPCFPRPLSPPSTSVSPTCASLC